MARTWVLLLPIIFYLTLGASGGAQARKDGNASANTEGKKLILVEASVCEKMRGRTPVNRAIVFPSGLGQIYCFTSFDPVPRVMVVYHKWYRRDRLRGKVRLTLKPPRWSTFSTMRIRRSDRGPWRIDIIDPAGRVLKTIRFSVTE